MWHILSRMSYEVCTLLLEHDFIPLSSYVIHCTLLLYWNSGHLPRVLLSWRILWPHIYSHILYPSCNLSIRFEAMGGLHQFIWRWCTDTESIKCLNYYRSKNNWAYLYKYGKDILFIKYWNTWHRVTCTKINCYV